MITLLPYSGDISYPPISNITVKDLKKRKEYQQAYDCHVKITYNIEEDTIIIELMEKGEKNG